MPQIHFPEAEHIAESKDVRVLFWQIEETAEALLALLPSDLFLAHYAQAHFGSDTRRREWLATRVLLHCVAGTTAPISYDAQGAPFLCTPEALSPGMADTSAAPFISISHSRGLAAIALSSVRAVGIDVERWSARPLRLAERFLMPEEMPLLAALPAGASQTPHLQEAAERAATLLWSAKEAAFKMLHRDDIELREGIRLSLAGSTAAANAPADASGAATFAVAEACGSGAFAPTSLQCLALPIEAGAFALCTTA